MHQQRESPQCERPLAHPPMAHTQDRLKKVSKAQPPETQQERLEVHPQLQEASLLRLKFQVVAHHPWRVEPCCRLLTRDEELEKMDLRREDSQTETHTHLQRELVLEAMGLTHPVQRPSLCLELAS